MARTGTTETIEKLAAEIGENVYIDIAKWHLYLRDAQLHTLLAERLLPMLLEGNLQEDQVEDVLKAIPVKLGGGKREVALADLLPMQSHVHLMDVLEEYQRNL
jgi:ABC-type phosphate transport system ATPase subunit